ncbi:long-chain fatty acid transport protein 4-like [Clytia hemisphaerica]|uniref:Long-chain-fatty-acid--CoA ligase n=1 Tax=Clytia hemisphaerica TaxID=252671 RepID=A0A7M5XBG0_9CNID
MVSIKMMLILSVIAILTSIFGFTNTILTTMTLLLITNYQRLPVMIYCLPRELKFLSKIIRMVINLKKLQRKPLCELFANIAKKYPDKIAIIDAETDQSLTFNEFLKLTHKIANFFQANGFTKGDNVAIMLPNQIEYIPMYLGLSSISVSAAFININQVGETLKHSLNVMEFKAIIYHTDLEETLRNLNLVDNDSDYGISPDYPVAYVFTSGTTGHPKPAVMARKKFTAGYLIFRYLTSIDTNDIVYNTLPMYHTSGSLIFFAGTILCGSTMVFRKKFSASKFLEDCRKYNVTYVGYIGEMMRYLLAQPEKEIDRQHHIKKIVGNGLRRSLFTQLRSRFNIEHIYEFYGATESNVGFINDDNTDGAVGFLFKCFPFLNLKTLVKIDQNTGELIRDDNGFCIECEPGEPGTMVGLINNNQPYYGYVQKNDSVKKVARNVFQSGDSYFMTGDLLMTDQFGYLYFLDRLGDTFRWKGENVSTVEIENIVSSSFESYTHCIVYGQAIPGYEGRAGMVYINDPSINLRMINTVFNDNWKHNLPSYALPVFVRVGNEMQVTSTFKYQKEQLKKEGFDLEYLMDDEKIFFLFGDSYVEFDELLFQDLKDGKIIL